jgi:L-aminopeptidase/D-esterase-like protein
MPRTGKSNGLTDVAGLWLGHHTDLEAASGTSVIVCPEGAIAGVDVRGAAPGTRETDLLAPDNLVEAVQAVCLSGGSVYGLSAADGVVRQLASRSIGFALDDRHVAPIVPAAVLYDLGRGAEFIPPVDAGWGASACNAAGPREVRMGCVGAGTGAMSGGIKGGLGTASQVMESGVTVAALAAVNSLGSTIDPQRGTFWEARLEIGEEFTGIRRRAWSCHRLPAGSPEKTPPWPWWPPMPPSPPSRSSASP